VASIGRRIEALEGRIQPPTSPEDETAARQRALARNILDEFASLKASCAVHYRGNKRIEPEDIPGKILGPGYTTEDVWELARKRVLERSRSEDGF
jgi:hypothetical protein